MNDMLVALFYARGQIVSALRNEDELLVFKYVVVLEESFAHILQDRADQGHTKHAVDFHVTTLLAGIVKDRGRSIELRIFCSKTLDRIERFAKEIGIPLVSMIQD